LELARRCAAGDESAWERFVREYRPVLYRAAHALDPSGGARELADSLYAELHGLEPSKTGERSLLQYFQGRSSLATWLRAVLARRYIDWKRAARRLEPLPDEDAAEFQGAVGQCSLPAETLRNAGSAPSSVLETQSDRYLQLAEQALARAVAGLTSRDRLRLACYYVQELTLAETGRLLGEHEATVSRQLARTRRALRAWVERDLRGAGLGEAAIEECFACAARDPGSMDLNAMLSLAERKESAEERS